MRTDQQRRGPTPKAQKRRAAKKRRAEKLGAEHPTKRAGAKAGYALERPSSAGKSSRKSTRGSANRAKPDTNFNLREEMVKGSPESRFRKAQTRAVVVRGRTRP
jgi:hypothetical protein